MNYVKILSLVLAVLVFSCCGSCGSDSEEAATSGSGEADAESPTPQQEEDEPITIFTTIATSKEIEAKSFGNAGRLAQYSYFMTNERYATSLQELLTVDKALDDNPNIRFEFGECNAEGFTFTVFSRVGEAFVFTD